MSLVTDTWVSSKVSEEIPRTFSKTDVWIYFGQKGNKALSENLKESASVANLPKKKKKEKRKKKTRQGWRSRVWVSGYEPTSIRPGEFFTKGTNSLFASYSSFLDD